MINSVNSKKVFKICLIVYAVLFIAGIIATLFTGLSLDINFSGGTRISYSYKGDIDESKFETAVSKIIESDFKLDKNTALAGDTTTIAVTLVGKTSLSAEVQEKLTDTLAKEFKDNSIELYDSNSVSPTIAGTFFLKSLVAVLITAALVIIYVGIRFRKIGGITAAITALCALVIDLLVTFFICAIFRLQIDSNYIAVVLTILGYSLNDTIVIYDRVRENKKYYPELSTEENMNKSIGGVMTRNIVTTTTTVVAVLTIVAVSELFGLTTLRTFAIPMAFGLVSGCFSSLFVSGPLWVYWQEAIARKKAKK